MRARYNPTQVSSAQRKQYPSTNTMLTLTCTQPMKNPPQDTSFQHLASPSQSRQISSDTEDTCSISGGTGHISPLPMVSVLNDFCPRISTVICRTILTSIGKPPCIVSLSCVGWKRLLDGGSNSVSIPIEPNSWIWKGIVSEREYEELIGRMNCAWKQGTTTSKKKGSCCPLLLLFLVP